MTPSSTQPQTGTDLLDTLYRDGIIACKGAFSTEWADRMREDIEVAFEEARSRPDGAVGRGPNRFYVEIHPEQLRGFVDLVTTRGCARCARRCWGRTTRSSSSASTSRSPGAMNQPWHRDFPTPEETSRDRRLNSLAFNLTGVDTDEDDGPVRDRARHPVRRRRRLRARDVPAEDGYGRYEERAVRKYPQRGDISARSALTIHRGTRNESQKSRPVLVLGVDAPGAGNAEHHDMAVTKGYWERCRAGSRAPDCPVVDELTPITQKHTIEGLVMGEA